MINNVIGHSVRGHDSQQPYLVAHQ